MRYCGLHSHRNKSHTAPNVRRESIDDMDDKLLKPVHDDDDKDDDDDCDDDDDDDDVEEL